MKTYDYLENVKEDVRNYIEENKIVVTSSNREEVEQELNDTLFVNDSVTGNSSGSYTFSTWQAEENLCHNFELLTDALEELGYDLSYLKKGAESCDVIIRCYLLGQAISEVLDEIEIENETEEQTMREQLINDLSKKISELKKGNVKVLGINDLNSYIKDLTNIRKVLKKGGNVLDIQNVAKWNYSAYFNVKVPGNISLKTYREINNNDISILKSVIL
mgnify:CR=1 FL=1|jgi:hypothetical protein